MAEIDQVPGHDPVPEDGKAISTAVNVAGAVLSFALLIGVGIWGYKLLSRDVSGVPVVRALEGPMRVQPDDPGGDQADHQGLAVNAVAAKGSADAPADRLMLAPRPIELTDEDQPVVQAAAEAVPEIDPAVQALVDQLTAGAKPLGQLTEDDSDTAPAELIPAAVAAPATDTVPEALPEEPREVVTGPGVQRSLRPRVRPARPQTAPAATPAAAEASVELNPETVPAGSRLAQLGAYDSPAVARAEWDRLHGSFVDYMDGKKRVIQKASSGGRTFYRLRAAGFEDLSDARRFCAVLVAQNADCIPVTTR